MQRDDNMPQNISLQSQPEPFRALKIVLDLILILILFVLLFIGGYFLYQNLPGEPENFNIINEPPKLEIGNLSYEVKQFYPGMKFNHNSISYKIDLGCDAEKKERMLKAFNELENKVGVINFYPVFDNPDIEVTCSEYVHQTEKDFFIAGEGGAKEIIPTGRYNVITEGIILLHENPHDFYKCEWPNIELHELLHVFGFDHSEDKNSLMYPYLESCEQKLDESIISDLKKLYSKENLADLYFENVAVIKKGRYLDFNVSIKNSGVVIAESVVLSVFDGIDRLEDFALEDIPFGAGVHFQAVNFKLNSRNSEEVNIVIDSDDLIKESSEENNVARLKFD